MKKIGVRRAVAALAVLAALSPPALAGDAAAGRKKAVMCQTCHGLDGISKIPEAPSLAGQPEMYLAAQLKAFRSGARTNEMMSTVSKGLSDQDIADLAAWYSSIEVTAKMPSG
jgi:cytochrome c553